MFSKLFLYLLYFLKIFFFGFYFIVIVLVFSSITLHIRLLYVWFIK